MRYMSEHARSLTAAVVVAAAVIVLEWYTNETEAVYKVGRGGRLCAEKGRWVE